MKKRKNSNADDENKNFNSIKGFYSRYVNNLYDIRNKKGKWILKGDSPFADGEIRFDDNRNWYCEATNETGDDIDFLRKENPLLTEKGANAAFIDEVVQTVDWNGVTILDEKSFRKELKSYRDSLVSNNDFDASEKAKFLTNNFWINDAGELNYMELSRTNAPLCRYHWGYKSDIGSFFLTYGVSRIKEHPEVSTIYFVQNPLQLITLKEYVNDPIYIKPDGNTYFNNDYLRMVSGKEIVFCSADPPLYCTFDDFKLDRINGNQKETVTRLLKAPVKNYTL